MLDTMEHSDSDKNVENAILEILSSAALAPIELKKRVEKRIPGLKPTPYKGSLYALLAAEKIHGLPKLSKSGTPTKTIEKYGFGAPPPPPPSPRERAPKEILELLKARALPPADLKERLKKSVPALAAKDL